jgi:hypothetical protein
MIHFIIVVSAHSHIYGDLHDQNPDWQEPSYFRSYWRRIDVVCAGLECKSSAQSALAPPCPLSRCYSSISLCRRRECWDMATVALITRAGGCFHGCVPALTGVLDSVFVRAVRIIGSIILGRHTRSRTPLDGNDHFPQSRCCSDIRAPYSDRVVAWPSGIAKSVAMADTVRVPEGTGASLRRFQLTLSLRSVSGAMPQCTPQEVAKVALRNRFRYWDLQECCAALHRMGFQSFRVPCDRFGTAVGRVITRHLTLGQITTRGASVGRGRRRAPLRPSRLVG